MPNDYGVKQKRERRGPARVFFSVWLSAATAAAAAAAQLSNTAGDFVPGPFAGHALQNKFKVR